MKEKFLLGCIVFLGFFLRLQGLTNSITDWHSFRQADTASVSREYVKQGIDLLHPKFHDYSNIASGKDNPVGYRMVEFPFINAFVAIVVKTFPFIDLVVFSRFVSIVFSLGTLLSIYFIGRELSGKFVAAVSAIVFAVLPYAVYYSRAILPEPGFLFFSTFSILAFLFWAKKPSLKWYLLSCVSLALALLLKPFGMFLAPVYAAIGMQKFGWKVIKRVELIPFVVLAFVPLYWWRKWIENYPEGIPASSCLFNSDNIRFRPSWFKWLFLERITKLLLGWFAVVFLPLSLLRKEKGWMVYFAWGFSILLYFAVIATGNVRHDYYQVMILPIICLSVGRGVVWIWENFYKKYPAAVVLLLLITTLGTLAFTKEYVGGYYSTRPDWEKAGQAADRLLPPNAKVIAPAFGDTAYLYQTNRTGWPIGFEIDDKIGKGAEYYVSTAYDDEARALEAKYQTIEKTSDYIILDLRAPKL